MDFFFPIRPIPQPRPHFKTSNGKCYTVSNTLNVSAFKKGLQTLTMQKLPPNWKPPTCNVFVSVTFARRDKRRCDVDNLLKSFFDALTGVLWFDDSQIVSVCATKIIGDRDFIEFSVVYGD